MDEIARPEVDEYPPLDDNLDEAALEDDDDLHEDAAVLFGIDVGDDSVQQNNVIDVDAEAGNGGGGAMTGTRTCSNSTHGTSSCGKHKSGVWDDFEEIKEGDLRIAAICKMCRTRSTAISVVGTGHLLRHQKSCRKKTDHAHRVQSRLALNPDGLHNWVYDLIVACIELCRLIARLDLPLFIGDTQA
jgi:hypothetical protein